MQLIPVKTRVIRPPKDDIYDVLDKLQLREKDILIITSKILSIHQGRCVKKTKNLKQRDLAQTEADAYLPGSGPYSFLTIKHRAILSSAGVDTKNSGGYFILPPIKPALSAQKIWQRIRKKHRLKNLGVIITDSHSVPLRLGTVGISLGHFGIEPLVDYTGQPSVFGNELNVSRSNAVDALAAAATFIMGEGNQKNPIVIVRNIRSITFNSKDTRSKLFPDKQSDMFAPLLKLFRINKK